MQMISLKNSADIVPQNAVWVLGFFDGVHPGHKKLLREAVCTAEALDGKDPLPVAIWSFSSLPKADVLLTTREESAELLESCGAEWLVLADFSDVSHLEGPTFFREHLWEPFSPAALVCGFNFRFGCGGKWNAADLADLGAGVGIPVKIVEACVDSDGETISSSRIRTLIQTGNMEKAVSLLGTPYQITASVQHGKQLGRTIGFPTINQRMPENKVIPAYGIYICRVSFCEDDGTFLDLPGVCNIGFRPTVNNDRADVTLETYILDYKGNLYGKDVQLSLYKKLRDEQKFPDTDALSRQIAADADAAKAYFSDMEGAGICL